MQLITIKGKNQQSEYEVSFQFSYGNQNKEKVNTKYTIFSTKFKRFI